MGSLWRQHRSGRSHKIARLRHGSVKGRVPGTRSGGHHIYGAFNFIWAIRPLDAAPWRGRKHFLLEGKASTEIRFIEPLDVGSRTLARWTIDVGDHQSPGAHFHYQFNGFRDSAVSALARCATTSRNGHESIFGDGDGDFRAVPGCLE